MSKKTLKEPIGLVLSTQKDKDDAREVSIKYGIKILYDDIFSKENDNHLYLCLKKEVWIQDIAFPSKTLY